MLGQLLETRLIRDPMWNRWAADGENSPFLPRRRLGEDQAMQLLAVYSSVRIISETIASLPVDIYRGKGASRQEVTRPPLWVTNPNVNNTQSQFVAQLVVSILLRGNAYCLIVLNNLGQVLELWPLHPDWVQVRRAQFSSVSPRIYFVNGQQVPSSSILHIAPLMMPGAIVGVDPITAARDALGLGLDAQTYGSKFFQNSAIPSGVVNHPGSFTLDQAKDLAKQWRGMHGGPDRAGLPAVLTGGATYQPITITNEQAQFLETRRYTDNQIKQLFGLGNPLESEAGTARITYANVEQISTDISKYALIPRTNPIEEAMTALLPRPQEWKFNYDAFLRGDIQTRFAAYQTGITTGFLTKDEAREKEDLPPLTPEQMAMMTPPAVPPVPEPQNAS